MIAVPYHLGRRDVEVGRGPSEILRAAEQPCVMIERTHSESAELDAVADVNIQLARAVTAHEGAPIVLAGNCNSSLGTLAGLGGGPVGIVWFDAHGDFNTPETTISGALEGMSLAIAVGHCHDELRDRIGLTPVREENVLLVATRSIDPGEAERLERSSIRVIELLALPDALTALAGRVSKIYLHLDLDVLDPRISPGVNFSAPGGITPRQLGDAVKLVAATGKLGAAAMANFNPDRDRDDQTLRIALQLVAILSEASLR